MQWKFLAAASFLTGALLLPHARTLPVLAGMVLAAAVQWGWSKFGPG